jgi:hypothetical protein
MHETRVRLALTPQSWLACRLRESRDSASPVSPTLLQARCVLTSSACAKVCHLDDCPGWTSNWAATPNPELARWTLALRLSASNPGVTDQGFIILSVFSTPGSRAAERADAPTLPRRGAASPSLQLRRSASNTSTSQSLRRQHRQESHPPWTSDLCPRKAGPKVCTPRGGTAARRVPELPP